MLVKCLSLNLQTNLRGAVGSKISSCFSSSGLVTVLASTFEGADVEISPTLEGSGAMF